MANAKSSRATRTGLKSEVCSASRACLCAHGMQLTKGSNRHQELRAIFSHMLAALFHVYAFKAYRWESAHVYPDSQRQAYILAKEKTDLFLCPFPNTKKCPQAVPHTPHTRIAFATFPTEPASQRLRQNLENTKKNPFYTRFLSLYPCRVFRLSLTELCPAKPSPFYGSSHECPWLFVSHLSLRQIADEGFVVLSCILKASLRFLRISQPDAVPLSHTFQD